MEFEQPTSLKSQNKRLLSTIHGNLTSSVCHDFFSSCRGRRADHAGKNRTSIGLSYQKLWPIEVSASNCEFSAKTALKQGFLSLIRVKLGRCTLIYENTRRNSIFTVLPLAFNASYLPTPISVDEVFYMKLDRFFVLYALVLMDFSLEILCKNVFFVGPTFWSAFYGLPQRLTLTHGLQFQHAARRLIQLSPADDILLPTSLQESPCKKQHFGITK